MSEVDRLSNSGLYPALPIGDKRQSRDRPSDRAPEEKPKPKPETTEDPASQSGVHRVPKSLIDEYA